MAWYKDVYYDQDKFIPISFLKQILPGMFEYMFSYLIDHELCPSVFDMHYNNDGKGKRLRKKNITDNESARMKTSKGIIQAHYM